MVPEGAQASRFQSYNNPSARKENVKRMWFAPQQTERIAAVIIGVNFFNDDQKRDVMTALPKAIANALQIDEAHVSVGIARHAVTRHDLMSPTRLPGMTSIDPMPGWLVPVYLDESQFDVEDIAAFGNELFLTIGERSFEPLVRLGVNYAAPPRAELEAFTDSVLGINVRVEEQFAIEAEWNKKFAIADAEAAKKYATVDSISAVPS